MRFRTQAVFGLALFVSGMAGCTIPQHFGGDAQQWLWKPRTSTGQRFTPYQPYGLSVSPYETTPSASGTATAKRNEFEFSHPRVDSFVTRFQTSLRGFYTHALSRSGRYVPRMSSILEKEGLPQELAYLPLIESGFQQHAVSRAGAVGPWQLIPGTGRRYGLRIDRYVDERRDPVKSTQAAAKYLKDLHDMFGDWHLSLAAYNTGEQNIVRILERGRAEDFWEMSDRGYLYDETRDFVPEFLAALHIAETPEAYGFSTPNEEPLRYDLVRINRPITLSTVAHLSGTSVGEIKDLNPALQRGVVPPSGYSVRLPKGSKDAFEVAYGNLGPTVVARHAHVSPRRHGHSVSGKHRTRRGAAVASVAKPHRASGKSLAQASRTRGAHRLRAGRGSRTPAMARRGQTPVQTAQRKGHSRILD
jgi:membrane-bound lytic murein transglycosylase D